MRIAIAIFFCTALTTVKAQNFTGSKQDIEAIQAAIKNFSTHVINSDYQQIGLAYTADAKIFPNNTDIIEGREAIINYWRLPEGVSIPAHSLSPLEIKVIGNEAYDYGRYQGVTKRANGEEVPFKGKYVIVWKKENGEWKVYLDIWNRIN